MVLLTSISDYCALNLPGLVQVEYTPIDNINTANYEWLTDSQWLFSGTLDVGDVWLSAGMLPAGKLWQENMRRGPQGKSYDQRVAGTIRNMRPLVSGLLDSMEEYRYLLRLTDRKGRKWILGNAEYAFEFSASAGTGDHLTGLSSYAVEFTAQTRHRAVGLDV